MRAFNSRNFHRWFSLFAIVLGCLLYSPSYSQKKSDTKGAKKGHKNAVKTAPDPRDTQKKADKSKKKKSPGGKVKPNGLSKKQLKKQAKKRRGKVDSGNLSKAPKPKESKVTGEKGAKKGIKNSVSMEPDPRKVGKTRRDMQRKIPGKAAEIPVIGGRTTGSNINKDKKLHTRSAPPKRANTISQYQQEKKLHTRRVPKRGKDLALPKENPVEWKMKPDRKLTKLDKDMKRYRGDTKMPTIPRREQLARQHSRELQNSSGKLSIAKPANDRKQYFRLSRKTSLYTGDLRIKWLHFHHRHPSLWRMGRKERPSSLEVYKNRKMAKKPKYNRQEQEIWEQPRSYDAPERPELPKKGKKKKKKKLEIPTSEEVKEEE